MTALCTCVTASFLLTSLPHVLTHAPSLVSPIVLRPQTPRWLGVGREGALSLFLILVGMRQSVFHFGMIWVICLSCIDFVKLRFSYPSITLSRTSLMKDGGFCQRPSASLENVVTSAFETIHVMNYIFWFISV